MVVAVLPADLEAQAQRLDARPGPAVRQRHIGEAEQAGELQVPVRNIAHQGAHAVQLGDALALIAALDQHLGERQAA